MKLLKEYIFSAVYILVILLALVDSFNSSNTVVRILPIGSRGIIILSIIALVIIRCFYEIHLRGFLSKLNLFAIFPIALITCVGLTFYDYFTYVNHSFQLTHIQYSQFWAISIFCLAVGLLNQSNKWFKNNYKTLIFISSFILFGFALLSSFFPFDFFAEISKEDGLIENTQVAALLIGALFSLKLSTLLYKKQKLHSIVFILVAIALIFIVGDEISWGQRIFHLVTPEMISNNNEQKEITIHNLTSFHGLVGIGYIIIGFYGTFAWILQRISSKLRKMPYLLYIPAWFCMGYFLFGFIYNLIAVINILIEGFGNWSEFAELMLYLGIMFTLISLSVKVRKS